MMKLYILLLSICLIIFISNGHDFAHQDNRVEKAEECVRSCGEECEQLKKQYCKDHPYSGCALDVFCWCNGCEIYNAKWCEYEGYLGCAEGALGSYKSCIKNCQAKREAGQDVSTCWQECNEEFIEAVNYCKDGPCANFCQEEGYQTGEWAKYTQEYGWDSCHCEGKIEEPSKIAALSEELDPALFPDEEGEELTEEEEISSEEKQMASDEIRKEKSVDKTQQKAPYKRRTHFSEWLFGFGKKVREKVGYVKALKNREEVLVFNEKDGEWYRVGVMMPLYAGDKIRTGPNSKIKVCIENRSTGGDDIIDIRPNTIFNVPGLPDKPAKISQGSLYYAYKMFRRSFYAISRTIEDRVTGYEPPFEVKTPTVVIGPRGTEFFISHDPMIMRDTVMVMEGEVEVTGSTNVVLKAGEQIKAYHSDLGVIEELDITQWNEVTEQDWDKEYPLIIIIIAVIIVLIAVGAFFYWKKIRRAYIQ
jgi:hypothetical protein